MPILFISIGIFLNLYFYAILIFNPMNDTLQSLYEEKRNLYSSLLQKTNKRIKTISLARLFDFLLAMILVYVFARAQNTIGIIVTIFTSIAIFIFLVKLHSKLLTIKNLLESKIKVNIDELEALDGNFEDFDKGEEFIDPDHPFSFDLDIFGEGSLFQFINRYATEVGKIRLANFLKQPELGKKVISNNQEAIKELSSYLDWRQNFLAIGKTYHEKKGDHQRMLDWVQELPVFRAKVFTLLIYIIPVLSMIMIYLLATGTISYNMFLLYLLIPWGISGSYAVKVNRRHNMVSKTSKMLSKYAMLLNAIEEKNFRSSKLVALSLKLKPGKSSAGTSIKQLSAILTALDNRLNFVSWALFHGLLLWDILQMKRLENWQGKHKDNMKNWFDVIAEIDALNSFSNYNYNNPNTLFPEIEPGKFNLSAINLGHPLIPAKVRINNDIAIHEGEFLVITGANMAGKSTFLRTIVVNMIMGMCGAPVCADKFEFSPVNIFTSIRTNDSLHKNESYFYSELKRLKRIIDELKAGSNLFVVLDEILKGTNSKDKHAGSEALLKQFISLNTSGIVATHDVALGKLEGLFPENIKNKCFEVDINGSQLSFDYKIRDGVSKNMNATILMREMGITV